MIPVAPEIRIARHIPPAFDCPRCGAGFAEQRVCQRCWHVLGERITAQPTKKPEGLTAACVNRFWSYVDRSAGPDACWPWTGYLNDGNYGTFNVPQQGPGYRQRLRLAHRLAWMLTRGGEIADGIFVCHRCDNRPCCNPGHLFLGSNADNLSDMVAKGRSMRGQRNPIARLSDEVVSEIRSMRATGLTIRDLGQRYGVHSTTILRVTRGETWRHVPQVQAQQHRAQAAPIARTPATRGTRKPGAAPLHPTAVQPAREEVIHHTTKAKASPARKRAGADRRAGGAGAQSPASGGRRHRAGRIGGRP